MAPRYFPRATYWPKWQHSTKIEFVAWTILSRPARLAGIGISNRNLSLRFKVWQRTVARSRRG
ncbi:hypothetical protein KIV45_09730 [Janthinobacterium lividum]|nr:hypothetical protein KIV45_09730 [Janthinobacterium lividum]